MSRIELPPGIALDDPRPIAAESPYTFFMPHPDELAALKPKDGIKAIFRQVDGETKYGAERMWVLIEDIVDGDVIGTLDNEPADMPLMKLGDRVRIPLTHAISTAFHKDNPRPDVPEPREYWERCFVDDCVLQGRSHVDYLYCEEPDMTREGDTYPDSGWRIRGTQEAIDADEANGNKPHYIAIGKVLNVDDRWLHLIDCGPDHHFSWDAENARYVEAF
ncbi:DUF2185 domain-containing protein [Erythrobacter sp. HKB08]|uniref:immunity protein Imm33 domain-containing protein n=1 Tax=Erythrobacter sp. HKB08 TaxID=2502843 RepID=UPI001009040C|nr:DUF2185 domain-containing protein [Erythrobacter sp. HKB08]